MKFASVALATLLSGAVLAQTESLPSSYRAIGIDQAWARGWTGAGTRIAVIDNGFALNHPDLRQRYAATANFYSYQAVTWGTHGTAMASIAAGAQGNGGVVGVAPQASLLLAQIGQGQNTNLLSTSAFDQAVLWASQMRADVVSMSLGYNYSREFTSLVRRDMLTGAYMISPSLTPQIRTTDALAQASRSSVLVISAGNQGLPYASFPAQFASRADVNGALVLGGRMIVVGSVTDSGVITNWSNRAGHICYQVVGGQCRDTVRTTDFYVVAPGVDIPAAMAQGQTMSISGTSPSAALVSGGMAIMRQAWPQLRPEQLVQLVLTTTRDLGAPGTDLVYGRGMVDFDRASRPQGTVRVAVPAQYLGTRITGFVSAGPAMADSKMLARMGFSNLLNNSQVLQSVQVLDSYDRNYRANFAQAIGVAPVLYNPDSAWLPSSYRTRLALDRHLDLVVDQAYNGIGTQLDYQSGRWVYQLQVGSMSEHSGYLMNSGSGALSLGSSSTVWSTLGLERWITDRIRLVAQFGQAHTSVRNNALSMIQTDPVIASQTWRLGIKALDVFRDRDQLQVGIADPVHITRGHARITAVTDYAYESDSDGNTIAVPIVSSERINLARTQPQRVLALNYQQDIDNKSRFMLSSTWMPGGYRIGASYNYLFK